MEVYEEIKKSKPIKKTLGFWWPPIILASAILIFYLVLVNFNAMPAGLYDGDEINNPTRFIGQKAANITTRLASLGPKVVGSRANEIYAVNLIVNEISNIIRNANPAHIIEYDIQKASGSLPIIGMTSIYEGIQNVIVKLSPVNKTQSSEFSLMLNSHFDTVPGTDGASDDSIMVAIMLETLRVLSQSNEIFQHSIIFLFNGAEENGLQGSHQFITQHRWAENVRGFINLDSAGSGGQDMLFQLTPGHPWLMNYYRGIVPHPFATVIAEEMFHANLIPSDTDFRIFRDHGQIAGLDIALGSNGYVYHTKYDTADIIPIKSYQNIGDNILALTKSLANAQELNNLSDSSAEQLIFFDYLGWFMITYTETEAIIINVVVSVVILIGMILSIRSFKIKSELSYCQMVIQFSIILLVQIISIIIGAGIIIVLSIIYDAANRSMSWFTSNWLLFGIYMCPMYFILGVGPTLYLWIYKRKSMKNTKQFKDKENKKMMEPMEPMAAPMESMEPMEQSDNYLKPSYQVQMFLHAQCLILIVLLIVLIGLNVRSAFLLTIGIIFYGITMLINLIFKLQLKDRRWIFTHIIGQILPFMFYAYMTITLIDRFVPMQGRTGPSTNPDIIIALICILFGIFLFGFIVPVFCLCGKPIIILSGFLLIWVISVICMATPVGFPYRENLTPQRFWIHQTDRIFHHFNGSVRHSDNGYFFMTMDRHRNDFILDSVLNISTAVSTAEICGTELFCGLPFFTSRMLTQSLTNYWIPTESMSSIDRGVLNLINIEQREENINRFTFDLLGPDHMGIFLSPITNAEIIDWSFNEIITRIPLPWNNRSTHFIFYSKADVSIISYRFWIDIRGGAGSLFLTNPSLDISLVTHYLHHDTLKTPEFTEFINSFPRWAHVQQWISSIESWQF